MRHNFIPMLLAGIISFTLFRWVYLRCSPVGRIVVIVLAMGLGTPAILMMSNYHLSLPYAPWFTEFRAFPGMEISAGLIGAVLGVMFASDRLRPARLNGPVLIVCTVLAFVMATRPFIEQLYLPAPYNKLTNEWKDGVCKQTSGCTCVPSCAATMVRLLGGHATEAQLAREAGTTFNGTEFWYLKRALRRHGYEPRWRYYKKIEDAPVPSILEVKMGETGHVVVLLRKDKKNLAIGEPCSGRKEYTWKKFKQWYHPGGGCITLGKAGKKQILR